MTCIHALVMMKDVTPFMTPFTRSAFCNKNPAAAGFLLRLISS